MRGIYYETLEKKISLLKELQLLANSGIAANSDLYPVYKATAEELSRPRGPNVDLEVLAKAFGGAAVWILILFSLIASDIQKGGMISGQTIVGSLVFITIAILFGWIGTLIPTVYSPFINLILFPIILFVILYLLFVLPGRIRTKSEKTN